MAKETMSSDTTAAAAAPKNPLAVADVRFGAQALSYWIDSWQRSLLFWDVMRERGNVFIEHEKKGEPPVLVFDYDIVVDGRTLEDPANYALVRIKPTPEYPTGPGKRPIVVVDPPSGSRTRYRRLQDSKRDWHSVARGAPMLLCHVFPKALPNADYRVGHTCRGSVPAKSQ